MANGTRSPGRAGATDDAGIVQRRGYAYTVRESEVGMALNIGSRELPLDALTEAFGIIGRRGSGKTYTAAVLTEEFSTNGLATDPSLYMYNAPAVR